MFSCPVYIENDANAATLGEGWVGAARGKRDFLMLTLGTGVGGGVVSGGKLIEGATGMAGELGHVVVEMGGPRCNCGGRGCIETFASATGIKRMLRERLRGEGPARAYTDERGELDVACVHRAAEAGDRIARDTLRRAGSYLGVAVAGFINVFNPELVVIGGGVAKAWDFLIPAAKREIARQAFRRPARLAKIRPATLGESAGWLGAAYVAWRGLGESLR
jgi:glucokinase